MEKRKLTARDRICGNGLPEIKGEWDRVALDIADELKRNNRKLSGGPLIVGIALYYCRRMSHAERIEIARWGLAELERIQWLPDPLPGRASAEHKEIKADVEHTPGPRKRTRKPGVSDEGEGGGSGGKKGKSN